jgi:hypothetical protein
VPSRRASLAALKRPFLFLAAALVVAGCSSLGGGHASAARRAAPRPALYVSPTGVDGRGCTASAPCASFDAAYHAASPGQLVLIGGGAYGEQTISVDATKTSPTKVIFEPAAGAAPTVAGLTVYGSHVEFENLAIGVWATRDTASDVIFFNVRATHMFMTSSTDISVIRGSIGPSTNDDNGDISPQCPSCPPPQRILIDGVTFHDAVLTPGSDAHVECLQVGEIDGLTIRNSRFINCETHNVFISPWWGGDERNILLVNNFGGTVRTGYYGFRLAAGDPGQTCANIFFRYNSATTAFLIQCGKVEGQVQMTANVGPFSAVACFPFITFRYNVFDGAKCGPTDRKAPSGFVDAAASDLHLLPTSAAVGHGDPKSFPVRDIDGHRRPIVRGRKPDAGAAQLR